MRSTLLSIALVICVWTNVAFAERAPRLVEGFQKLDEILVRAGGVKKFLAASEAREEYFRTLQKYDFFIRPESFSTILRQLESTLANNPELEKHFMSQKDLGKAMRFESTGTSYGRGVDANAWKDYLSKLQRQWKEQSAGVSSREEALEIIEEANKKVMDLGNPGTIQSRGEKIKKGQFLNALKNEKKVRAALSYLAFEEIERRNLMQETDANKILAAFDSLREDPTPIFSKARWIVLQNETRSFARSVLPSAAELLSDQKVFPPLRAETVRGTKVSVKKTLPAVYEFIPIPRRFHSIFKAFIVRGECIGGTTCMWTVPARWGTGVVPHSDMSVIYRDKIATGFVHTVPLTVGGEKGYRSLDLASDSFSDRVVVTNSQGLPEQGTLFDLWLEKSYAEQPKNFRGYLLGRSGSLFHGSEHTSHPSFYWGEELSDQNIFLHDDPVAKALARNSTTNKYYNGTTIVTDATVYDQQGRAVLLTPSKGKALDAQFPEMGRLRKELATNDHGQMLDAEGRAQLFATYAKEGKFALLEQYYLQPRSLDDLPLMFEGLAAEKNRPGAVELMKKMLADTKLPEDIGSSMAYMAREVGILLSDGKDGLVNKILAPNIPEAEQMNALMELTGKYKLQAADMRQLEDAILRQKDLKRQTSMALILRDHKLFEKSRIAPLAWEWTKNPDPRIEQYGWGYFRRLVGEQDSKSWKKIRAVFEQSPAGREALDTLLFELPNLQMLGKSSCASDYALLLKK